MSPCQQSLLTETSRFCSSVTAVSHQSSLLLLTISTLLCLAGCTAENSASIHGKVTLDSEPVANGSIEFLPTPGPGKKAAAAIDQGLYSIPATDKLPHGSYRVKISWHKPTGRQIPSADPGIMTDERREAVPARFNAESTLTVDITSGNVEKNFELLSK